jgi:hypothetical protein
VKAAFGVFTALLLMGASPAVAGASGAISGRDASTVLAQASPSPTPATGTTEPPTASPSPGEEGNEGGIATGAGIVIAAILVGGLLLMRSRLLRR